VERALGVSFPKSPRLSHTLTCCKLCIMPNDATFESFEKELNRLVESFGKRLAELKQPGYMPKPSHPRGRRGQRGGRNEQP
jgi:hypothetical protein